MMESIEKIVSGVRTKEERDVTLSGLRLLEKSIFQKNTAELSHELSRVGVPVRIARSLLEAAEEQYPSSRPRPEFSEELRKSLEELIVFRLEVSFDPREKTMDKLKSWAEREIGKGIIFDITVDHSIRGGTKLSFRGRYREYTFENLISSVLSSKREEIAELIS